MTYSLICCVVNMGDASKVINYAKKHGVQNAAVSIGQGTVNSRLLEFFAINEVRKEIVTMAAEYNLAAEIIKGVSEYMGFEKPNQGIAFSHSISEVISGNGISDDSNDTVKSPETGGRGGKGMYKIIYVIVDKGNAECVIEAANKAGARGGTIINARGAGDHEIRRFFFMEIEPEKEEVFIITKKELKDSIVESIREHLKIDEPGNGLMFVMDLNEVYGISQ
ncbi:MAG: P-II family nitrogen regulator [Oscillospiraceae bacterium]|nr:P-II family nitrogen regulator [Oscillospiraceae bacterium]